MPRLIAQSLTQEEFDTLKVQAKKTVQPGVSEDGDPNILWADEKNVKTFWDTALEMMEGVYWTLLMIAIVFTGVAIVIVQFSSSEEAQSPQLEQTTIGIMVCFIIEVLARHTVFHRVHGNIYVFWKNPYNVLDFSATFVDVIIALLNSLSHYGSFGRLARLGRLLRLMRFLRLLRLVRILRIFRLLDASKREYALWSDPEIVAKFYAMFLELMDSFTWALWMMSIVFLGVSV